ncbi:lytic murein transglycosylase [Rahnella sikkimica]|uniref:Lytic murein transglycosylase n=1 Tax=Rahnella sikkimica TaxID=1805933 RepID=A0A2L1UMT9_9GAMM|nr:lytic murein transglycosylase [Rahnella sikkimica]AVF34232.1 lytic murein transglycosylase [Rahnella sikkimica]
MKLSALAVLTPLIILSGCAAQKATSGQTTPQAAATTQPSAAAPAATSGKTSLAEQGRDPAEFPAYVEKLKAQALAQGISQQTIDSTFANLHFVDRVINSDRNQLEKKITLDDYLTRVLPEWKIKQGQTQYQNNLPALQRASDRYGVQPQYIVALWAMESSFGKIQGKEDVFSALATLAFEGRREAFFTKEFMAALKIVDSGHATADMMKGSWAGAMGQSQFMPSSYLNYGADGNGDGKIDIWKNTDDVFASTANYLSKEGWKRDQGWGQEVKLPAGFDGSLAGLKNNQMHPASYWQQMGVTQVDGGPLASTATRAWIITPDDTQGRAFLVYDNFRTIMHWNRSTYFALSIGMMADGIMGAQIPVVSGDAAPSAPLAPAPRNPFSG